MQSPCNYRELEELIGKEIKDGLEKADQRAIDKVANTITGHVAEFVGYKHVELRERDKRNAK